MSKIAYFGVCEDEIVVEGGVLLEIRRSLHEAFDSGDVGILLREIKLSPFKSLRRLVADALVDIDRFLMCICDGYRRSMVYYVGYRADKSDY